MSATPATGINARARLMAWASTLERTYRETNQWYSRSTHDTDATEGQEPRHECAIERHRGEQYRQERQRVEDHPEQGSVSLQDYVSKALLRLMGLRA